MRRDVISWEFISEKDRLLSTTVGICEEVRKFDFSQEYLTCERTFCKNLVNWMRVKIDGSSRFYCAARKHESSFSFAIAGHRGSWTIFCDICRFAIDERIFDFNLVSWQIKGILNAQTELVVDKNHVLNPIFLGFELTNQSGSLIFVSVHQID